MRTRRGGNGGPRTGPPQGRSRPPRPQPQRLEHRAGNLGVPLMCRVVRVVRAGLVVVVPHLGVPVPVGDRRALGRHDLLGRVAGFPKDALSGGHPPGGTGRLKHGVGQGFPAGGKRGSHGGFLSRFVRGGGAARSDGPVQVRQPGCGLVRGHPPSSQDRAQANACPYLAVVSSAASSHPVAIALAPFRRLANLGGEVPAVAVAVAASGPAEGVGGSGLHRVVLRGVGRGVGTNVLRKHTCVSGLWCTPHPQVLA